MELVYLFIHFVIIKPYNAIQISISPLHGILVLPESQQGYYTEEFTKVLLNIISNFIPHETKKLPRDDPWITKPLKTEIKTNNTKGMVTDKMTKLDQITFIWNVSKPLKNPKLTIWLIW